MTLVPVIALVGRPNVGKSTLFNRLTASRNAIVADVPGLTRDRQYGRGRVAERSFIVIDTGGFEPVAKRGIEVAMARQARQAVIESDWIVFIGDGRVGLTAHDRDIANELRRAGKPITLALNKTEGMRAEQVAAEFHELGLGEPVPISAAHGEGVRALFDEILDTLSPRAAQPSEQERDDAAAQFDAAGATQSGAKTTSPGAAIAREKRLRVAVVGRPNVGKSTLINTLLGEERLIAFDEPGTTRDAVAIDFERGGKKYTLVDTAGMRRRGKVNDVVEKFSMVKTLQAIDDSNVCILMLDASQEVADQDAAIAGHVLEAGRALVIAVNKWDAADSDARATIKLTLDRKLYFLKFAATHFVSARAGSGIGALMRSVETAYASAMVKLATPKLTRSLQEAVARQAPPRKGLTRPKMRYAHQGGHNPPIVVIHGSGLDHIAATYHRYLETWFRDHFKLQGTPLRIEFRTAANPYAPE